jgi:hypothetical protein
VTIHTTDDVGLGGVRVVLEQADGAEDHTGRAPPALHGVGLEKRLLHGMQFAFGGQAFDGDDALARHRAHFGDATLGGRAIDEHGAGGALSFAAAVLGAGEVEIVAEDAQ